MRQPDAKTGDPKPMRLKIMLRNMCCAVFMCACAAATAADKPLGEISAFNPGPGERSGVAVAKFADLGITPPASGAVKATLDGTQLQTQISGDQLGILLPAMKPGERKTIQLFESDTTPSASTPTGLRFVDDAAALMTLGDKVNIRFDKKAKGLTHLQLGDEAFSFLPIGMDTWIFPETTNKDKEAYASAAPRRQFEAADYVCEPLAKGPLFASYRVTWSCPEAKVEQRFEYHLGSQSLNVATTIEVLKPFSAAVTGFFVRRAHFDLNSTRFMPFGTREIGGYQGDKGFFFGAHSSTPGYVLAQSPKQGGLGLVSTNRGGLFDRFIYATREPDDTLWPFINGTMRAYETATDMGQELFVTLQSGPLNTAVPGTSLSGSFMAFTSIAGANAETTFQLARLPLMLCAKADPEPPLAPENTGGVAIESLKMDKVLYDNNATAVCEVVLRNWSDQPQKSTMSFELLSDIDGCEVLPGRSVTLAPFERRVEKLVWNTGARQDGHEIVCRLAFGGKELDRKSECFNIATDWEHLMQWLGTIRGEAYYLNVDWYQTLMSTDGDINGGTGFYRTNPYTSSEKYKYGINGTALREAMRIGKSKGRKQMLYAYIAMTPFADRNFSFDPAKILYMENGQAAIDWFTYPNIYSEAFRSWFTGMISAAIDEMDWDAAFWDVAQAPPENSYKLFDWQGRPAGIELGKDADSAGASFYKDITSRIKAKHPKFAFTANPEVFKSEFLYPQSFAAAGSTSLIEMGGGGGSITDKGNVFGKWQGVINTFNSIRATKRRYNVEHIHSYIMALSALGGDTCSKTMDALTFASGFGTGTPCPPAGSAQGEAHRQYMRFGAARYSALIYGKNRSWIDPDKNPFTIATSDKVLWREYAYERPTAEGKDLICHLVQLPPSEFVYRQPERQETLANLKATIAIPAGMTLKEIRLLSPDRATADETLQFTVADGKATVTIPDLLVYDIIVARLTNK
jgi:hypothetical protein